MTQRLWAALSEVEDPEMPVNLVDLGVIYGVAEKDGAVDVGPHDAGGTRRARSVGSCRLSGTSYKRVSGDAVEYEVFARKARVDSLHLVGSVVAPDADLAIAYARATYDEERWCEMAIVRKDDVIRLWSPGEI